MEIQMEEMQKHNLYMTFEHLKDHLSSHWGKWCEKIEKIQNYTIDTTGSCTRKSKRVQLSK
ncbi:unnamed protein product [Paramecium primaurelia]|uniref:Uncharacterized protein n=1 Tax=Paramecium primaurelia TaxID=5886 RepID=A0A8S1KA46_PARPR|nr:unnamed protein product [Paramecium primaurelia]